MKQRKIFRSRLSVLLMVFLLVVFIVAAIPMIQDKTYQGLWGLGITFLFVISLFTGIRYVISGEELSVQIWFFTYSRANIHEITVLERSYNPISSPAGSLKRLQINFLKGGIWLISPVKEELFIKGLKSVNKNIIANVNDKRNLWRIQDWDI